MSDLVAIEVHDAHLRVARQGSADPLSGGPGFALIEDGRVLTGLAARGRARLRPRLTHSRFWDVLDTEPLGRPYPEGYSCADLAHAHLGSLWARVRGAREVVLVVSPASSEDALALLLGIAGSLGLPVVGLVDAAVAAAVTVHPHDGDLLYLDLRLHRAELARLRHDGEVVREALWNGEGWGLVAFQDALARRVAEGFVRTTRFDPLHVASTEQALHDALPVWLARLQSAERTEVVLESGGHAHVLELRRKEVEGWSESYVRELTEQVALARTSGAPARVLLTESAAVLPGLAEGLAEVEGVSVERLPTAASARGALRARPQLEGGEASGFVLARRLRACPAASAPTLVPPPREPDPEPEPEPTGPDDLRPTVHTTPTHLLLGDLAYRLDVRPLVLGSDPAPEQRGLVLPVPGLAPEECRVYVDGDGAFVVDSGGSGCFVNGVPVAGEVPLSAGDRLQVGQPGIVLDLVREAEG